MGAILKALLLDIPEEIGTERLALRAVRAGQGAATYAAFLESRDDLRPWMPWASATQDLLQCEEHCRLMQAKWHAREELDFGFYRKADGELIGKGGLHTIDWTVPRFEIGYWVRSSATRQGFATEATLGLLDLARKLGGRRVEIGCDTRNRASRRVAEKCGFFLEGILRQHRRDTGGELADSCMYAKVF